MLRLRLLQLYYRVQHTVTLLCFTCKKPLRFCHFLANLSNLRSYLCECAVPILASPSIFSSTRVVLDGLSSVGVREVGISFLLLSNLLVGLLLQHTLHTSVCFVSCNHFDPSVLVAGKLCSWNEILANTSTHLEKKTQLLKKKGTYSTTFTVDILHKAGNIHYHCFSWNSQLMFIGLMSTSPLSKPTKSHPHKFNYCDLFFAMLSALTKFAMSCVNAAF